MTKNSSGLYFQKLPKIKKQYWMFFSILEYSSSELLILQIKKLSLKNTKRLIPSFKTMAEQDPALNTPQQVQVNVGQLQGHSSIFITTPCPCGPECAQQKPESS